MGRETPFGNWVDNQVPSLAFISEVWGDPKGCNVGRDSQKASPCLHKFRYTPILTSIPESLSKLVFQLIPLFTCACEYFMFEDVNESCLFLKKKGKEICFAW